MESENKTSKQAKQNRNILIDTENKPKVAKGEEVGRGVKTVKGIKKYKLSVIKILMQE